jgi:hypothetical protein
MYGIDSPVRQLANQNAGNPQQLMQSYAQDPSLVKLLALEQLKQDLAAREASITAQLQNNPATILQQREQEVLGGIGGARNTSSVTAQTAGALNQQARQQQQAPQQAPQPGGSPMEQGIASQPATNMQRMASGGIVGFSKGGSPNVAPTQEELSRLNVSKAEYAAMPRAKQEELARYLNAQRGVKNFATGLVTAPLAGLEAMGVAARVPRNLLEYARTSPVGQALGLADVGEAPQYQEPMRLTQAALKSTYDRGGTTVTPEEILEGLGSPTPTDSSIAATANQAMSDAGVAPSPIDMSAIADQAMADAGLGSILTPPTATAELAARNTPQSQAGPSQQPPPAGPSQQLPPAGLASLIQVPSLAKPSLEMQKLAADQLLRQQQAVARDPRAEGTAARDEAAAFQRREEQQKDYAARIAAMDAANAEASDPKKLARERLISFLAGTANTGGLGSWGRGGVRAGQATQTAQRAAQQERNLELFNAMNTASTADRSISSAALTEGANVRGEGEAARLAGVTGLDSIITADAERRTQEQKLATEVAIANAQGKLDTLKLEVDKARVAAMNAGNNISVLQPALTKLQLARDKTYQSVFTDNVTLESARNAARGKPADSKEAIALDRIMSELTNLAKMLTVDADREIANLDSRLRGTLTGSDNMGPSVMAPVANPSVVSVRP